MNLGDPTILGVLRAAGPRLLAEAAWSVLLGRRRSLAEDAARVAARLDRPLRVEGRELVPTREPFVLMANHYQAPGLWVGLLAMAITAAVAGVREPGRREIHWMVLSEWGAEVAGRWVPHPLTSLLFPRACRTWPLIPTPPNPADVAGRARALRSVLTCLGRPRPGPTAPEPVGIFPEGTGTVALQEAMPGTGAFLHRLSGLGVPLLPAGSHQAAGSLVIRFGSPFFLGNPPAGHKADLDTWARQRIMVAIARLLPAELWGAYEEEVIGTREN